MKYRFLLNITHPENYSFFDPISKLYLNFEYPLNAVETLSGKLERAVLYHKIIDLDNAYPDINDNLSERNKADIAALLKKFNITQATTRLNPLKSINNEFRDEVPPPKNNTGVVEMDLIPKKVDTKANDDLVSKDEETEADESKTE